MILQELCMLYDRLSGSPEHASEIPQAGWSRERVSWALVIDFSGQVTGIVPVGTRDGDKLKPASLLVPEHDGRSGKSPKAYFLCDKASFLLGLDEKSGQASRDRSRKLHHDVLDECDDGAARAVLSFFDREKPCQEITPDLLEKLSSGGMVAICLDSVGNYVHERHAVREAWQRYADEALDDDLMGYCAVTGEQAPLARLFPQVTGVPGAQSSGASLVSFNFNASESYGRKQSFNASISREVAFRAGSSLKYLLSNQERYEKLGNTIVTYWSDRAAPAEEGLIASMLLRRQTTEDKGTLDSIARAFSEMRRGVPLSEFDPTVRFCILGISPNAARLSVRFFETDTLGKLAENYGTYLRDVEMDGVSRTSIWGLILQTAPMGKPENIPSTLVNRSFSAVLGGSDFPVSLEQLILSRMRADHAGNKPWDLGERAALLKGCLVRRQRIRGVCPDGKERLDMSLNRENTDIGYLLGRLFAVMERAQQGALGDTNATIRDKYIGAASSSPTRVFQSLLRGCQPHLGKLRKDSARAWLARRLESELDAIMDLLPGDNTFPGVLSMDEQAMFFVGYYQERTYLWASRKTVEDGLEVAEANREIEED